MTNRTTAGQMEGRERIRKAARQAHMQANDGTQARTVGTGMTRPKNGKVRTDKTIEAR